MGKRIEVWWSGRVVSRRRGGRLAPKGTSYLLVRWRAWRILLDMKPWRGYCVRWTGRVNPGDWPSADIGRHYVRPSMAIKKREASAANVAHLAALETNLLQSLQTLVDHCCLRQYEDGTPREPGWLTIKTQGAAWVVQVKDPDSCTSFSAVGDSVDKALETAALLLGCEEAPWEPDTYLAASKARKKR